ncbi:type VI secretion system tube protein TssD, partial [Vibrio sp. Vb2424]|uniref:type VI secretion system tube protein TssD n=1 Tax=Vibrio sp. Vb2424 TaxID=2816074 RepID=UPI001A8F7C7E
RTQNINFQPVTLIKLLDKSSPLLANAIANNERLEMTFNFYRTSQTGSQEKYYTITLREASIINLESDYPHSSNNNEQLPEETLTVK